MRGLLRILALLGGLAAVGWAVRRRFVSVALPREPTPPEIQAASVTDVKGIGPTYATRLESHHISTLESLADAEAEEVAAAADVTVERAGDWIAQARQARP